MVLIYSVEAQAFLFPAHLFTMERLHCESDSSKRFRMKMHEYAAHHQALVEESYAKYRIKNDEYQRQRRQEKLNYQKKKKCEHDGCRSFDQPFAQSFDQLFDQSSGATRLHLFLFVAVKFVSCHRTLLRHSS